MLKPKENPHKKGIIIALDCSDEKEALDIVLQLRSQTPYFKIGLRMFTRYGSDLVKKIQDLGGLIFLDLKFHDIPQTVMTAISEVQKLGVFMTTLHVQGGREMMNSAYNILQQDSSPLGYPPHIVAVTCLTSLSQTDWDQIGYRSTQRDMIKYWIYQALEEKMSGVVLSGQELDLCPIERAPFLKIVPGIRLEGEVAHDQKRIMTPTMAFEKGASFLVMGRSITEKTNKEAVLEQVINACQTYIA